MEPIRIAVLVSGGGTNLQALIDAASRGELPHGRLSLVVSNVKGAYALARAEKAGIPALTLTKKAGGGQAGFEKALQAELESRGIDMLVLAGFLSILSGDFAARWPRRIINIHPALIPSFCGNGSYGLRVHKKALAYGVKVSGATSHFVVAEADAGPIILQKAVKVEEDDTPEALQRRIMEQAEWKILPESISLFCQGRLVVEGRRVRILPEVNEK